MTTNPSHILIARNSRGPSNASASLSSPTETHAAAAGIFRSSAGSPPWFFEGIDSEDAVSEVSISDSQEPIEVHEAFTKGSKFPGTVKIVVESTTFWAHKEVLWFASPFFQAALSGNWAETGRPLSMSSVITISQPPTVPGDKIHTDVPTAMTFASMDPDLDSNELDIDVSGPSEPEGIESLTSTVIVSGDDHKQACGPAGNDSGTCSDAESQRRSHEAARIESLEKLQGAAVRNPSAGSADVPRDPGKGISKGVVKLSWKRRNTQSSTKYHQTTSNPDAVIILREEKASTFHDFLRFVYPGMECTITWNNVEGLMNIGNKLCVPSLQRVCLNFLLTHAAGRPIKAMRIAELFEEEELYREASRFVLDNPGGWPEQELNTLSSETLLRLEKRRTWFLERVLKLGLIQIAKEYECCPSCPDPPTCARLLDEKWRQAYQAVFRFGPCQPSMVFRYLRTLEGVSPPLALSHLTCQTTAKAFIATLFDRMFSLGVRGSGTDTAPLGARVAAVAGVASATLPRRHFLYCSLRPENPVPPRGHRHHRRETAS
ncbi:hypothetical protein F5148DRAFT_1175325 [Russula earlei]|uniref:Uncharacterized protein n=1 Tax=Russula earlei TaxID=71964 RepID=A0ACC0UIQ0_9AGAM|nr:hypothetical protein F5148DRAFT_1175325 [Russula earlei]